MGVAVVGLEQKTLGAPLSESLQAKRTAGRRDRYIGGLGVILTAFAKGREAKKVSSVTTADIEAWVPERYKVSWSRATVLNRLSTLFSFCVRRRSVQQEPVSTAPRLSSPAAALSAHGVTG